MPQRGDPLSISARDWTDMQRVVDKFRNGGVSFQAPAQQVSNRNQTIVKVLNDTGDPLEQCGIVGLGEPVILPTENEMEFIRNIAFKIVSPKRGRWGVLQAPVAAGEITTAIVSGVTACKVNVASGTYPNLFADAISDDFAELRVDDHLGNAQILWKAGGTGSQWAVIRIGNPAPKNYFGKTTSVGIAADSQGQVYYRKPIVTGWEDTSSEWTVWSPTVAIAAGKICLVLPVDGRVCAFEVC